jgi:GT2 family glycosyltransferase
VLGVSIVLFRSDYPHLLATLRSVSGQSARASRVLITVNASTIEDAKLSAKISTDVPDIAPQFIHNAENLGFSAAHNRALEALFAEGCTTGVVLNPDVVLEPTCLERLEMAAAKTPAALFGPVLELADPQTLAPTRRLDTAGVRWTWDGRHFDVGQGGPVPTASRGVVRVDAISGACLFVPRLAHARVLEHTGEFFDDEFIAYREDAELGFRAGYAGVESFVVPEARALHVRRLRGTARGVDDHIDRLGVRNRFLIAFKYGRHRPGRWPWPYVRDLVVVLGVVLRERSSWPGIVEAWQLRHAMRAKHRRLQPLLKAQH